MKLQHAVVLAAGILSGSVICAADTAPDTFRARPFKFESTGELPKDLKLKYHHYVPECKIHYLIEGPQIASFQSLTVESIKTPDGVEVSKQKRDSGSHHWHNADISEDRKYCVFAVEVPPSQFGNIEKLSLSGHVELLVGSDPQEMKLDLSDLKMKATKVGPYTVQLMPNQTSSFIVPTLAPAVGSKNAPTAAPSPAAPAAAPPIPVLAPPVAGKSSEKSSTSKAPQVAPAAPAVAAPAVPASAPKNNTPTVSPFAPQAVAASALDFPCRVEVQGPDRQLISTTFTDGENEVHGFGAKFGDNAGYELPKPASGKLSMTIRYWKETKPIKVPLENLNGK